MAVAGTLPGQASHWFTLDAKAGERFTIEVYSEPVSYTHLTLPTIYSV